jgi:hypothetical protein
VERQDETKVGLDSTKRIEVAERERLVCVFAADRKGSDPNQGAETEDLAVLCDSKERKDM